VKKAALAAVFGFVAILLLTTFANAQTVLAPGSVTINPSDTSCHGLTFDTTGDNSDTSCYNGIVACASPVPTIHFTIGFAPAIGAMKGTIVFFSHGDGTTSDFANYVTPETHSYNSSGFQTAQVVWWTPWEENGGSPTTIQAAACRPAGILDWFFNPLDQHVYTTGGRCAEGLSAGSAAIGYSLAEYGEYNNLDNVELHSGPVLSDIEQGCVPPFSNYTICTGSYCHSGTEGGWPDSPEYLGQSGQIDLWTGVGSEYSCTGMDAGGVDWKSMSIVDHSSQNNATYYYPHTAVNGWICGDDKTNAMQQCTQSGTTQNNSAIEGYIFYDALSIAKTPSLNVYRVDSCGSTGESVGNGYVPAKSCATGQVAIMQDMVDNCGPH
jgi:hypothetical protein